MTETASRGEKPVLLVTGASSGIGYGIARRFAAAGYRIVAIARRKERLDQLAQELSGTTEVVVLATDVTTENSAERAVDLALSSFGRLDCLVNNAGAGKWAPIHRTDDAMIDEVIEISLKAPIRFSRAALRVMRPGASIINIGSVFGIVGGMDGGVYCVAKAGLIGLTQALAVQYGARGIRSNLVAPGVVKTDMTQDYWDAPAFQRVNQEMTPMNRDCTVEDVANAVYFLASEQGSFINGHTLALDGGWSSTKFLSYEALVCKRVEA
jgi:meso-butanediol dehydrogenase/(S,S)-butanediol dehydrogenase/diacetyl reductase